MVLLLKLTPLAYPIWLSQVFIDFISYEITWNFAYYIEKVRKYKKYEENKSLPQLIDSKKYNG